MSEIKELGQLAALQFDDFIKTQIEENPDLLLKYNITPEMKAEFIEGVLLQFWETKEFDVVWVMEYMVDRFKSIRRK